MLEFIIVLKFGALMLFVCGSAIATFVYTGDLSNCWFDIAPKFLLWVYLEVRPIHR
jgi:hypothetical protein